MTLYIDTFDSPIGPLSVAVDEAGRVHRVEFVTSVRPDQAAPSEEHCREARQQILDYLAGRRDSFDLELEIEGSDFERQVWGRLRRIPYGRTISYGEIASTLGRAGAARAVGRAVGANPLPLLIPCHRVVGSDGSLTGFGGGLEIKRRLLELEASQHSLEL
jgi:O-6-methylguanine DNA methyltransferase